MAKAFFSYFCGYESGGDFVFGKTVWAAWGTKNMLSCKVGKFHFYALLPEPLGCCHLADSLKDSNIVPSCDTPLSCLFALLAAFLAANLATTASATSMVAFSFQAATLSSIALASTACCFSNLMS
jgi:hypothetical protein